MTPNSSMNKIHDVLKAGNTGLSEECILSTSGRDSKRLMITMTMTIIIIIISITTIISNGKRTEWSPIRSVIILVINKSDFRCGRPILLSLV